MWPAAGSRKRALLDGKDTVSTSHIIMTRGAPQGNEIRASERILSIFMPEPLQIRHVPAKFAKLDIHRPTLAYQNPMPNKCSQTPGRDQQIQRISNPKLTDGYRKRLSGSRAINQNAPKMPDFQTANRQPKMAHRDYNITWTEGNRLHKSFRVLYNKSEQRRPPTRTTTP